MIYAFRCWLAEVFVSWALKTAPEGYLLSVVDIVVKAARLTRKPQTFLDDLIQSGVRRGGKY